MKNHHILLISTLFLGMVSCKQPDACINASANQIKLGQNIIFTDCSVGGKSSEINFGDGSKSKTIDGSITYAYSDPGTFSAKIEHYNKSEKKKDVAITTITVDNPTIAELTGSWQLNKKETFSSGFSVMTSVSTEVWAISSGGFTVDGGSSYSLSLAGNNFSTNHPDGPFSIAKLYNNELVLRYDEVNLLGFVTYQAYHFVKL